MYLALVLIKACTSWATPAVRRFGGEVHTLGVMFLIFSPLPYMDATAAWAFRSKWRRVLVGAAGMIAELFAAAVAVFVWASTGPGILHSLAYNTIFVASLSTILFNINPLLRFDGYYILSDLLDIPNLHASPAGSCATWWSASPSACANPAVRRAPAAKLSGSRSSAP
jgi:putative peptide zinc metalloprotease protein